MIFAITQPHITDLECHFLSALLLITSSHSWKHMSASSSLHMISLCLEHFLLQNCLAFPSLSLFFSYIYFDLFGCALGILIRHWRGRYGKWLSSSILYPTSSTFFSFPTFIILVTYNAVFLVYCLSSLYRVTSNKAGTLLSVNWLILAPEHLWHIEDNKYLLNLLMNIIS